MQTRGFGEVHKERAKFDEEKLKQAQALLESGRSVSEVADALAVSKAVVYKHLGEIIRVRGRVGIRPPKLDEEKLKQAQVLLESGCSVSKVSDALAVSQTTLYRYLSESIRAHSRGFGGRPRALDDKKLKQAQALLESGRSVLGVCNTVAVSEGTLHQYLGDSIRAHVPELSGGPNKLDDKKLKKAQALLDRGQSVIGVCDALGVSQKTLYKHLGESIRARGRVARPKKFVN